MFIDSVPIWGIFLATIALVIAVHEMGYQIGGWALRRGGAKSDVSGAMVGATMALVSFMIAFTFNGAAGRHDARKSLLVDDVNLISTAWLRAGLLAEPQRAEVRQLLADYVKVRVDVGTNKIDVATGLAKSDTLQDRMWAIASDIGVKEPGSFMKGLFVESLNGVIESQLRRLTASAKRVPQVIWVALYVLTALGMLMMGIQAGLGRVRQTGISLTMALAFSIVLSLVADLDRPSEGYVNVSQQAMVDLQAKLDVHAPTAPR